MLFFLLDMHDVSAELSETVLFRDTGHLDEALFGHGEATVVPGSVSMHVPSWA